MNLKKVLSPATVTVNLPGSEKLEVIEALVDLAMNSGKIKDREQALESVVERERKMTTGMEHGIAIPHGKTDAVDDLVVAVGVTPEPIDFEAMDKQPCRIFIMTLSPVARKGPHIQFLAEITRILKEEERRKELLAATSPREVINVIVR
ncbi:MAG: PTS transporter subunit EIIA [Spirochaetes bacterium]|jgi:PTS system nitrogen regulatory IIA component|nr:PTS transporter subunit EIIA [Spirochaetota bacterium]